MSFYSDASLVLIPSGYKNQKIYSAKPTDGLGDLVFSRASNATRVASNGLIEKVRTNLLTYSEQFDNAAYNKGTGGSISANTVVAPDGTTTADAYTWATSTSTYAYLSQSVSGTSQNANTFSIYIKRPAGSGSRTLRLTVSDVTTSTAFSSTFTVTEFWQRFEFSRTSAATTGNVGVGLMTGSTGVSIASGEVLHVWGAQLETGDIATDYIATTTAAVSVGPVSGLPRLDYPTLGQSGSCPRLLLEPQRTNLLTYSEQFDNAAWTKQTGITITANTTETLDPSGYYGADKVVSTSGTTGFFQAGLSLNTTLSYTRTIYLKGAVGGETLKLKDPSGFGPTTSVTLTNSWQRYEHITTATGDAYQGLWVDDISNGATIYAWGAQLEAGAYATSYIPTLGTSVTRVADSASKTGISSLIGQTEGAFMIDVNLDARANFTYFALATDLASAANYLGIGLNSSSIIFESVVSAVLQAGITLTNSATGRFKIAVAYKANDFVMYVNGTLVGTDTSGSVPACSQIGLYNYNQTPSVKYNQALLFKTRLTNESLASLTTL